MKRRSFTIIELQVAVLVLTILWLMIAGIEFFLMQNMIPVAKMEDSDLILSSVFEHMERHMTAGYTWQRAESSGIIDVTVRIPSDAAPSSRSSDTVIAYRFDTNNGTVTFFPDGLGTPATSQLLINNLDPAGMVVAGYDPSFPRDIYIRLTNQDTNIFTYRASGASLSRIIRVRSLW